MGEVYEKLVVDLRGMILNDMPGTMNVIHNMMDNGAHDTIRDIVRGCATAVERRRIEQIVSMWSCFDMRTVRDEERCARVLVCPFLFDSFAPIGDLIESELGVAMCAAMQSCLPSVAVYMLPRWASFAELPGAFEQRNFARDACAAVLDGEEDGFEWSWIPKSRQRLHVRFAVAVVSSYDGFAGLFHESRALTFGSAGMVSAINSYYGPVVIGSVTPGFDMNAPARDVYKVLSAHCALVDLPAPVKPTHLFDVLEEAPVLTEDDDFREIHHYGKWMLVGDSEQQVCSEISLPGDQVDVTETSLFVDDDLDLADEFKFGCVPWSQLDGAIVCALAAKGFPRGIAVDIAASMRFKRTACVNVRKSNIVALRKLEEHEIATGKVNIGGEVAHVIGVRNDADTVGCVLLYPAFMPGVWGAEEAGMGTYFEVPASAFVVDHEIPTPSNQQWTIIEDIVLSGCSHDLPGEGWWSVDQDGTVLDTEVRFEVGEHDGEVSWRMIGEKVIAKCI